MAEHDRQRELREIVRTTEAAIASAKLSRSFVSKIMDDDVEHITEYNELYSNLGKTISTLEATLNQARQKLFRDSF